MSHRYRRSKLCVIVLFINLLALYLFGFGSGTKELVAEFESYSQQPIVEKFKDRLVFDGCGPNCVVEYAVQQAKYEKFKWERAIPKNYPFQIPLGTQLTPSTASFSSPRDAVKNLDEKFFYEDDFYHHLDQRYSKGNQTDEAKFKNIHEIFKQWALFADSVEMPYWIMHGSLLGWYWGGKTMPFDDDIDIQVLANNLYDLEKHHKKIIANHFLLEVNPNHVVRKRQDNNVIDARFIDMQTGHFIDITGVSKFSGIDYLLCKTPHFYRESDLFPLHRTTFGGIPTWRPNNYMQLLRQEYTNGPYFNVKRINLGMAVRSKHWQLA
ncbi:hypothetical protein HDV01_001960 [Terramyces sp. JEL0728]|nr:hypothetical protein HDV01_001960 [Terramyces sp. JEL0728]